eukprot:m.161312 g.161312  ORF g.161312 m.161312 type:complete len:112 (-) comp31226_c0_seq2:2804-3139(-)
MPRLRTFFFKFCDKNHSRHNCVKCHHISTSMLEVFSSGFVLKNESQIKALLLVHSVVCQNTCALSPKSNRDRARVGQTLCASPTLHSRLFADSSEISCVRRAARDSFLRQY